MYYITYYCYLLHTDHMTTGYVGSNNAHTEVSDRTHPPNES